MNVIDRLDAEWEWLVRCPRNARALVAWGREDPDLAFDSLASLVAVVERRGDPRRPDRVLAALARRAGSDDRAARVMLQLLLPGCKALIRRLHVGTRDERAALIVAAAYDRIRTYPFERRPERIAANVLFDVRHQVVQTARDEARRRHVAFHTLSEDRLPAVRPGPEPAAEAVALIGWAVRQGLVDLDSARLIVRTRLGDATVADVAAAQGMGEQTLRRRRLRVEGRLRSTTAAA